MTETKNYINDPGYEVPSDKILIVPFHTHEIQDTRYVEILESLKGQIKRDWFTSHFYYCLPLNIGNQYGFLLRSAYDFDVTWDGSENNVDDLTLKFYDNYDDGVMQTMHGGFTNGILTIQNRFHIKTPPGVNVMTIQPPNMFIPGLVSMTAVVETDQLRRDFSFNLKLTDPGRTVSIKKGDPLGAFIPVPRYFVDSFSLESSSKYFDNKVLDNEKMSNVEFSRQRVEEDTEKPHYSGRKYFNGEHAYEGETFVDHQKRI